MSKIMYEVTGWPVTCPSEKFSEGLYTTRELAEKAVAQAYIDYSKCEFEIEEKWVRE